MSKFSGILVISFLLINIQIWKARATNDDESCYSFAGGTVYPAGDPKVEHQLQYTKAVSKFGKYKFLIGFLKRKLNFFCFTVSKPAPHFEGTAVVNGEFRHLSINDYLGKYVVFFFYPLDLWVYFPFFFTIYYLQIWNLFVLFSFYSTFVCPTEILAFSDRIAEFRKINTEVIACSVDSHFTHLAWINTPRKEGGLGEIKIPLLSDITHKIAKDYGVYLDDLGHTLRGLFIIDQRGILRQITMNDLPVGRSVDETLRLVQAFQYTDTHGEVCPANWKPGSDTVSIKYISVSFW